MIWAREAEVVHGINATHENALFLPGIKFNAQVRATARPRRRRQRRAHPGRPAGSAHARRAPQPAAQPEARPPLVLCAKGIERGSLALMTDVLAEEIPDIVPAVLSGPGFAKDVARGLPTATTIASPDEASPSASSPPSAFRPSAPTSPTI